LTERAPAPESVEDIIKDIAKMIDSFVRCRMYSFADRLANATNKEVIEATLYEALRVARSALDAERPLCEDERGRIPPYVAKKESVQFVLNLLERDLLRGLELVRKIAIRAVAFPSGKESR